MKTSRTDWFYRAGWGLFLHFLAIPPSTSEVHHLSPSDWNRQVNAFDVETLARQVHELGAGYLYLTIGQNSGYYCSPNSVYDSLVGPGWCSERDLIADLSSALAKYRIPLLVYLPAGAPMGCDAAVRSLSCIPPWDFSKWGPLHMAELRRNVPSDSRLTVFQQNWESIIREWSLRWKESVRGWWFDGCYFPEQMYDFPEAPNFTSFASAVRAGNPNSLFAMNPGVLYPPKQLSAEEDYIGGEINDPWNIPFSVNNSSYRAQYHILTFAGQFWRSGPLNYTAGEMAAITQDILHKDGVITWDIPFDSADGTILPEDFRILKDFAFRISRDRATLPLPDVLLKVKQFPEHNEFERFKGNGLLTFRNPFACSGKWDLESFGSFSLEAGESRTLPVELSPGSEFGFHELTIRNASYSRTLRYPVCDRVSLTREFSEAKRLEVKGVPIGEISLASDGETLRIKGVIKEEESHVSAVPWMGSSIELFLYRDEKINQYFLVPRTEKNEDRVCFGLDYEDFPGISFLTHRHEGEYSFEVEVPLSLTNLSEINGGQFELKVNTFQSFGFTKAQLFRVMKLFSPEEYRMSVTVPGIRP